MRRVSCLLSCTVASAVLATAVQADHGSLERPASQPEAVTHADRDGDPLPPGALLRLGTVRLRHKGAVYALAFAPDGKTLASAGKDRTCLWDASNGREIHGFKAARCVSFSPDGAILATGSDDGTIRLWNVAAANEIRKFEAHASSVNSLAFSPDGKTLASGSDDECISLRNPATGVTIRQLMWHKRPVNSLAFSSDGITVASAGDDETVRTWDASTGKQIRCLDEHSGPVMAVVFSPDGTTLTSAGHDGGIRVAGAATGTAIRTWPARQGHIRSLAISANGKILASGSDDGSIRLWDANTGKERLTLAAHAKAVTALAFAPDGKTLASASLDHAVRLWEVNAGKEVLPCAGGCGPIVSIAFSRGNTLASASQDRTVCLWDLASGKAIRAFSGGADGATSLAFAADGKTLTSTTDDGTARAWNNRTGAAVPVPERRDADEQNLARQRSENAFWFPARGTSINWARKKDSELLPVGFSPSRRTTVMVFGDAAEEIHLRARRVQAKLRGHTKRVETILFSADERLLVSGSLDHTVRLWDVDAGSELFTLKGHRDAVQCLALSPDGKLLATGSLDETVQLWEIGLGQHVRTLATRQGGIRCVAISPDGKSVASGGADGTTLVWSTFPGSSGGAEATEQSLQARWADLAGNDSARAYEAIAALAATPRQTLPFLRKQLTPAPPERLDRLIADLDNDQFTVRQQATSELQQLGDTIQARLRQELAGASVEKRSRLETLLGKMTGMTPARRRCLRAMQVLELIASDEARALVKALATNAPSSQLRQEAKAALDRLAKPE